MLNVDFTSIEKFCLFIGYPRSGHSLIGSLLDAHPNAIIAHEADALKYLGAGMQRQALFELLLNNSIDFAQNGREWTGYDYSVPDQWQGKYERLLVIGDKKGGRSTNRILDNPALLEMLLEQYGQQLRLIHVVRNPYDNISTRILRRYNSVGRMIDHAAIKAEIHRHFKAVAMNDSIRKDSRFQVLDLRHESIIEEPRTVLERMCQFLDLKITDEYLNSCASIVFGSPSQSRFNAPWTPDLIEMVEQKAKAYDFLAGYTFHPPVLDA